MAKCDLQMPEEFLKRLSSLGAKTDDIIGEVLRAGGRVMLDEVRKSLRSVIGKGTKYESRSTGELEKALGLTKPRVDSDGVHDIKIGFMEPRGDGESNAKIANILEYGKSGQPPKPFLKPAKSKGKKACLDAMKQKMEEEVGKL